jgi:hypothetical protein
VIAGESLLEVLLVGALREIRKGLGIRRPDAVELDDEPLLVEAADLRRGAGVGRVVGAEAGDGDAGLVDDLRPRRRRRP